MEIYVMMAIIIYLGLEVIALKNAIGGIIGYMTAKKYAMPSSEELDAWRAWYLKKSLGLRADLPDRF